MTSDPTHCAATAIGSPGCPDRHRRRSRMPAPGPSGSPAAHPGPCSSTPPGPGCCSSGPAPATTRSARCGRSTPPPATETLVADPRVLLGDGEEELSDEERARRERSREAAAGVVGFATDESGGVVAFALSSRLWLADLRGPEPVVRELPADGAGRRPPARPHGPPGGLRRRRRAARRRRRRRRTTGPWPRRTGPRSHWGVAEFVAAEEMGRYRGLLVGAGRLGPAGGPGRRRTGAAVAHGRPGAPGACRRPSCAYPAAGTRQRRGHRAPASGSTARRTDAVPGTARPTPTWSPRTGPAPAPLLHVMSRDQRGRRRARRRPATGATSAAAQRARRRLAGRRRRRAGPAAGRPARHHRASADGARRLVVDGDRGHRPDVQVSDVVLVGRPTTGSARRHRRPGREPPLAGRART